MKPLTALIVLCMLGTAAHGQSRKLPQLGMPNQQLPDTNIVKTGMSKVKIVALVPRNNKLDTDYIFTIHYTPAGYLQQTEEYQYDSVLHEADADYTRISGKLYDRYNDCSRIEYTYDAHNNILTKKLYEVKPAGSYEAFFEDMAAIVNKRMNPNKQDTAQTELKMIADSLKQAGIPANEKEGKWSIFKYDADENMTYSSEGSDERHYTYVHDDKGRVKIMREMYNRNGPGSPKDVAAAETWLTYTPDGLPASITTYLGRGDTGDIATDKHMMKKEEISYNKYGQPVRILTSNSGKPYHKAEVRTYKGNVLMSDAIYEVNRQTHKNDTTTLTTFTYRKGYKASALHKYYHGKVMRIEREEVYLDDNGLQTMSRQYAKAGARPEQLLSESHSYYSK